MRVGGGETQLEGGGVEVIQALITGEESWEGWLQKGVATFPSAKNFFGLSSCPSVQGALAFPRLGKGGRQRYTAVVALHRSKKTKTKHVLLCFLVAFFIRTAGRMEEKK